MLVAPARLHARHERPITFRYRPAGPVSFVDLYGDLTHWLEGHPLRPTASGWLETTLHLGPGVYHYKFRHDGGAWHFDPLNPRRVRRAESENNLLVVGGTAEPVIHAPASPWVSRGDDGRVEIHAEVRDSAAAELSLRWDEGHGPRIAPMREVGRDGELRRFSLSLPASSRELSYLFVLRDGPRDGHLVGAPGGAGQPFQVRPADHGFASPDWWRDAVVYSVFLDRFRRSAGPWLARSDERDRAGGDLLGVRAALPHLAELGVNVLHLTPLARAPSAHRYDAIAPREVDPALGGEEALRALLDDAHARGIRIFLDVTVTHVQRDFFAFADVRARGPRSPHWEWFDIQTYPFTEGYDPGYRHYTKGEWDQPLLRTDHPGVVDYLVGTFEHWARFGVDGFRVDAVAGIPLGLTRRIAGAVRAIRPDAVLYGEVIPNNTHRWTNDALDAATDFQGQEALYDWLWRGRTSGRGYAQALASRRFTRGGPGRRHLAFTATHDQPRLASLLGGSAHARARVQLGQLAVLLGESIPLVYYGDELGQASGEVRAFEDAWPDRLPLSWEPESWDSDTLSLFREAIALRRAEPTLRAGELAPLPTPESVAGVRRHIGTDVLEVYLHGADTEVRIPLPPGAPLGAELLFSHRTAALHEGELVLGPFAAAVVRRRLAPATAETWEVVVRENARLAAQGFAQGWDEVASLPTRLYLTLTERCNIRCAHCITDAPARTKEGRARSLQPWLLDELTPALEAASYFGFSHGGESMVAPLFRDTLARVRELHRGRAYDVHLLTNGMLLDEARVHELVSLGVTSLAVSLDGASPATNDLIRVGGKFARVIENVARAVEIRERAGYDLRIGLSSVVSARALGELPALGALAARLGVDWLKVEEMYPATAAATNELVAPDDPRLIESLGQARRVVEASGLVFVDHLQGPGGDGGCGLCASPAAEEVVQRFRLADDFANRATFRPCRALWEQACVDPDGTVHAVDYLGPPLGNLLDSSMLELWNGDEVRHARRARLRREPATRRARCVLPVLG